MNTYHSPFVPREIRNPYPWGDLTTFRTIAEGLSDAIKQRVATENRVKRGGGAVDAVQAKVMLSADKAREETYRQLLMQAYQSQVPQKVRDWAASIPGIATGELFPRMLGLLGHPRVAIPYRWEDRILVAAGPPFERSLRQLWQYAGCGDPRRVPRSDILGHSPTREDKLAGGKRNVLRPLLYTFSSYIVKAHTRSLVVANSAFYKLYVQAKANAQGNRHEYQCQNKKRPPMRSNGCGTVLHPELGAPGSVWRPGHIDMHAHRLVQKELLRQLWEIAGDL